MDSRPTINNDVRCTAETELHEAICRLWQETFGDDRNFIMHYLSTLSTPGSRILRFAPDGSLIAMMHFHPFTLNVATDAHHPQEITVTLSGRDADIPCYTHSVKPLRGAYIYGVATAKEWRSRGIARAMIAESIATMKAHGLDFAMLIAEEPSLREWYASMGFRLLQGSTAAVTAPDGTNLALDIPTQNIPLIYPIRP